MISSHIFNGWRFSMSIKQQNIAIESLGIVPIVVDEVDAALEFYTELLGFEVRIDSEFDMGGEMGRWVTVRIPGDSVEFSLMSVDEAYYDEDTKATLESKLGSETRYTFQVEDCEDCVEAMTEAGVEITEEPKSYPWGKEATFADPSGNTFSLFEYASEETA